VRLGEILAHRGVVTPEQVTAALAQHQPGERIGQTLVRLGCCLEDDVLAALSEQTRIPLLDLGHLEISRDTLDSVAVRTVFNRKILPVSREAGMLRVALADPVDLDILDELRLLSGCDVEPVLARPADIERLIHAHYGVGADEVDRMVDMGAAPPASGDEDEAKLAEDASLIKFVNQILAEAVRSRASDIHIEPFENQLRIRTRVDGVLHAIPVPREIHRFQRAIVSRIKIMSGLNIAEKRLPQDGRITTRIQAREIDVRVSVIPGLFGEGVCLRLLDPENIRMTLEDLGMPPRVRDTFQRLIAQPHGIILVTGPTGSGKTTTLYAALQKINRMEDKIITVEDPVEYQLPGAQQIQVQTKIGLTDCARSCATIRTSS
jgi:general secretion pathway protein E/type IV pilus assembly protein PilB